MTLSFIEHHITNALRKSKFSMSGVSTDIFIRVNTLAVLRLSFVLIRFFLLNPLSQSTDETGMVRANDSNFSSWSCISLELGSRLAIPWIDELLKFLAIVCLKVITNVRTALHYQNMFQIRKMVKAITVHNTLVKYNNLITPDVSTAFSNPHQWWCT